MAYGAVTRNLVKQVGKLEAEIKSMKDMITQMDNEIEGVLGVHADYRDGKLSGDEAMVQIESILLGEYIEDLQNSAAET